MQATTPTVDVDSILQQKFGFSQFLPGQREAITSLLAGNSTAVVFPTGGGKSICYQLPALVLDGLTLVVSPLIALMKDQIDALQAKSIDAARLDSSLSFEEYTRVMQDARNGKLKLLYVAPERFNNERFRESLKAMKISLFAVDEAHCISEWGHNFRPDYLKLVRYSKFAKAERVLALTATAPPEVLGDICEQFEITEESAITTQFYRPNLTLLSESVTAKDRDGLLLDKLKDRDAGSTIVYVTLQKTAERLADKLMNANLPARAYHAGLKDDVRNQVQDWFMESDQAIVVATIAFGMGIDKSNIRYVYHYNLPKSIENYAQEIGRAGRDGKSSTCEMLVCQQDLNPLENFIFGDTPTRTSIEILANELLGKKQANDHSFYELAGASDIRMLVVKTLVTYLELEGYLELGTPFFSKYQFLPLQSSKLILSKFEGERRKFLASVFLQAHKASKWCHIDVDRAAENLKCERNRIVRALDYLSELSLIELRVSGSRQPFTRLKDPEDLNALIDLVHQQMQEREERDLERINQVLDWAFHDQCQSAMLSEYFGQALEKPCGHCSSCLQQTRQRMPREQADFNENTWKTCLAARSEHKILEDPHRFACWICGITLPSLTKARLSSNQNFGAFAHVPFKDVLQKLGA